MSLAAGVASKGATAAGTSQATGSVTTQATGSLLIAGELFQSTATFSSIADSKSNAYTQLGTEQNFATGNGRARLYYKENAAGGASHTATFTNVGSAAITDFFGEFTGALTAGALDGTVQQVNDSASPFTLAITPSAGNRLLVALFGGDSGSNPATHAESSGFTIISNADETNGASFWTGCLAYRIVVGDGTTVFTASFTETGGSSCSIILAAFKEAPSNGGRPIGSLMGPGKHPGARRFSPVARGYSATVATDVTVALTGSIVNFSAGVIVPSSGVPLTGVLVSYAAGAIAPSIALALTGSQYAWSTDTLTPSIGGDLTLALTGTAIAFAAGTLAPSSSVALTGSAESYSISTLTVSSSNALAGIAEAYSTGVLTPSMSVSLAGSLVAFNTGTLTPQVGGDVTVALTGVSFGFAAGTMVASGADTGAQFSGGFGLAFEAHRTRRHRRKEREQQEQREVDEIQAELDREIARLLYEQQAKDADRDDLARIQKMADQYAGTRQAVPRNIAAALLKAQEERSRNALEQLQREMERMLQDEEIAALLVILNQ